MKEPKKYIDLFCGAGGWSEGLSQQGFKCVYSVDFWGPAAITHSINHPNIEDDDKSKNILDDKIFCKIKSKLENGEVDLLIGSPPCTQFSFANRGGNGNILDGMELVRRFLEVVDYIQNKLKRRDFPWIMENVPRLSIFMQKNKVPDEKDTYEFNYTSNPQKTYRIRIPINRILSAADYGAPQKRLRYFCGNFNIPKPSHINTDVSKTNNKYLQFLNNYDLGAEDFLPKDFKPWRTLGEILSLPNPDSKPKSVKTIIDPNYKNLIIKQCELHDHYYDTSISPGIELYECQEMKQHHRFYGVMNFPDDSKVPARTVMATYMNVSRETIIIPSPNNKLKNHGKKSYAEVFKGLNGQKDDGFRRLTIRELACIMGFPITYQFHGDSVNTKHKLIGNAVSPFISNAFARMFIKDFFHRRVTKNSLKKPKDYEDYGVYEKTHIWRKKNHRKSLNKFEKHLRTTKSDGQRIDFCYNEAESKKWRVELCIGSGPQYKRYFCDDSLLEKLISMASRKDELIIHDFSVGGKAFFTALDSAINSASLKNFIDFRLEDCFNKTGRYKTGTPIYYIEDGIDKIIRKMYRGKTYDFLQISYIDAEFKKPFLQKKLNQYTLVALIVSKRLIDQVNEYSHDKLASI